MLLVSTRPNSIAEVGSETSLVISHDEFMMAVDRDEFLEVNIKHPLKIQTCISLSMLHTGSSIITDRKQWPSAPKVRVLVTF